MLIHKLMGRLRLMAPAGDEGTSGGGVDRGDDFTPTGDDAPGDNTPETKPNTASDDGEGGDGDPEGDEEPKDPKKDSKKGKGVIPLERHQATLAKERERREAAERELAKYQGGEKVAQTNAELDKLDGKVSELEKAYTKQMADGEPDKAAATMAEIRQLERQRATLDGEQKAAAAEARAVERVRYETALERIEEAYPALNEDHEDFDKDTFNEVVELKTAYQLSGHTPTKALQKAVKVLLGAQTGRQGAATSVTPRVDTSEVDVTAADRAKQVAADRKKEAVSRTTDAVKRTPPSTDRVGLDSDKLGTPDTKAFAKMNQDQFAKAVQKDPDALAKARGDFVG
jgi:hypothetical protein